jgi:DNA repair ATPase RecN
MTDEEINRKFDLVAGHLASLAVGLQTLGEKVNDIAEAQRRAEERMERAEERMERAEARWERTEAGIRNLLAIAELHEQEMTALREAQERTDERLNILVGVVERFITGQRGAGENS